MRVSNVVHCWILVLSVCVFILVLPSLVLISPLFPRPAISTSFRTAIFPDRKIGTEPRSLDRPWLESNSTLCRRELLGRSTHPPIRLDLPGDPGSVTSGWRAGRRRSARESRDRMPSLTNIGVPVHLPPH